ncbi:cellulose biosynthesis protein BcsN [Rhizobium sp. PL01]|uniref:cellulose biosynthesis protein BcsN n=1 Tax=Rhizobium sp. PL01 TaxID=3085631 RepID=UPI002980B864|nr:cellulose biosynthesis protein BcsN [Rhizobium sp. PL01]MDW5314042.1 cellulose biosynthesis protein BcsN [Rhizobium sp. PL01]
MKTVFPAIALVSMLASCTSVVDDPFLRTGAVEGNWPSLATTVSPEYAVAALPGLPATTVRQTGAKGKIEQTIVYANATDLAGENILNVTIDPSAKITRSNGAPSRSQVAAEMRSALAGVKMQISPVIADNAYGVFGYATGTIGKGGSCIYAWQFAKNIRPYDGGATTGGAAQIRMRYCSPTIAADRIVALMQGLRLNPASSQNIQAFGSMAPASAFAPVPFIEKQAETAVAAPVRRVKRHAVAEEAPVETATVEPAGKAEKAIVNAVKVPMPGDAAAMAAVDVPPAVVQQDVSKVALKPSLVPLPAAVAHLVQ